MLLKVWVVALIGLVISNVLCRLALDDARAELQAIKVAAEVNTQRLKAQIDRAQQEVAALNAKVYAPIDIKCRTDFENTP